MTGQLPARDAIDHARARLGRDVSINLPLADAPLCQLEPVPGAFGSFADARAWLAGNIGFVEDLMIRLGAVRLRNFAIGESAQFEDLMGLFPGLDQGYAGGSTRREPVGSSAKVFESTRAAPEVVLGLHQEMAYLPHYPGKLVFYCATAPETGGETMIGDMRRFTRELPEAIARKLDERGLRYWRNFRCADVPLPANSPAMLPFFHMAWQDQFGTSDRDEAESRCRAIGLECYWEADGSMTSRYDASAFAVHPRDGGRVFHNVVSSQHALPAMMGQAWWDERCARFQRDRHPAPPYYIEYGDGSPLDPVDCATIASLLVDLARLPRWQRGDVLMIDNIYTAHGRNSYTGQRDVQTMLLA